MKDIIIPFVYVAAAAFSFWLISRNRIEIRSLLKYLGVTKLTILGVEMSVDPLGEVEKIRGGGAHREQLIKLAEIASPHIQGKSILWVDDIPHGNKLERASFRALGINVVNTLSTEEALDSLERDEFDLLISDVGRGHEHNAGFQMLDKFFTPLNEHSQNIIVPPIIIYHGTPNKSSDRDKMAHEKGAIGATHIPSILYASVLMELVRKQQPSAYFQLRTQAENMNLKPLIP